MDKCKTWYTAKDGTVVGLWPGKSPPTSSLSQYWQNIPFIGSNLHAIRVLEHPRWEDYEYERMDDTPNRLFWLGDGQTMNESNMTGDRK